MKQIFKNQFWMAVVSYSIIIGLAAIPIVGFLQKIKLANEKNREELSVYQNLKIKDNRFLKSSKITSCDGNLFFKTNALVTAMHIKQGHLYLSSIDNKLTVVDLTASDQFTKFNVPVLTDFYSDIAEIYGTDFFNDNLVRLVFKDKEVVLEKVYPKIGRVSAATWDKKGNSYVSGYASGNLTKIIGRDGFIFLSGLDKITGLYGTDNGDLLIARFGTEPALVTINLDNKRQTIIEQKGSVSSLAADGNTVWAVFDLGGNSQIKQILDGKFVDSRTLNCLFPLKIAVWQDKIFYTSLEDNEGKIYWINKNLQKNGI